eukprot:3651764-Pyramimonas_sp.AAC.1
MTAPHPSCGPKESSTECPSGCARMTPPSPFQHTHHTLRGPIGSSTDGPSGFARMTQPQQCRHTAH